MNSFPFRSPEFAARADAVRRKALRDGLIWVAPLIIAFIVVLFGPLVAPGLPAVPRGPASVAFLILMISATFALGVRSRNLIRHLGLQCPFCGTGLVGTMRFGRAAHLAVLETGRCPQCDAQLIDPNELQVASAGITPQALLVATVLVVGLASVLYCGGQSVRSMLVKNCIRRYATAHNSADSTLIDATLSSRRTRTRCGDLRRAGRLSRTP